MVHELQKKQIAAEELIGETIGQYKIIGLLNETKKSWIFEAYDFGVKRGIALKVLRQGCSNERLVQLLDEGERLGKLDIKHKGLPAIFCLGNDKGLHYIAMELVKGNNLQDRVDNGERFSLGKSLDMTISIADAVSHAHKAGINHHDIKLRNVSEREYEKGIYVLEDFGDRLSTDELSNDVVAIGYMAEQLLAHREEQRKQVPKKFEQIVETAKQGLYETPKELLTALQRYKRGITRRKFLKIGLSSAALTGIGHLAYKELKYLDSLEHIVSKIRKSDENDLKKIDSLFQELNIKIFNQKIKKLVDGNKIKKGEFPFGTIKNREWFTSASPKYSDGFWCGILWQGYHLTGDEQFEQWAEEWTKAIKICPEDAQFTTAVRFFHSHANAYDILQELNEKESLRKKLKSTALSALDLLVDKFDTVGQFIPLTHDAFRSEATIMGDVVPFLVWGYKITGNQIYLDKAIAHTNTVLKYNLRKDYSFTKTAIFDPHKKIKLGEENSNGHDNNGSVSRVQANVHLGLTEMYHATSDKRFLEILNSGVNYFVENLPADGIPKCDFNAPTNENVPRDSSASSLEQHVLSRLFGITNERKFGCIARALRKSLVLSCLSTDLTKEVGVIKHACSNINSGSYRDESLIYGDYYFLAK